MISAIMVCQTFNNIHLSSCIFIFTSVTILSSHSLIYQASRRFSNNKFTMSQFSTKNDLVMDAFCIRQFNNPDYTGTQVNFPIPEFENRVNDYYRNGYMLVDGYAPFCKHLFIPNFAGVKCGYALKTEENRALMESCYEARKENELAVLIEYISREKIDPPDATFLDIILYSREQIILENVAMGSQAPETDAPWGIISVKGQTTDYELPMQPITMMRNALGKEFGGSGIPLDFSEYKKSVEFWTKHVAIK